MNRFNKLLITTSISLPLLSVAALTGALAQGNPPLTSLSRFWASYKTAGTIGGLKDPVTGLKTWTDGWLYFDWPLQLTKSPDGSAHVSLAPEFTCFPQTRKFIGTMREDYPLGPNLNPKVPVVVHVNGQLVGEGDEYSVTNGNVVFTSRWENPKIVIQYCSTAVEVQ